MRLINTETLELHEVLSIKTTPYAILSHRWDDDEVTFQDLRGGKAAERKGWKKILGCCAKAFDDGWDYMVSLLISATRSPIRASWPRFTTLYFIFRSTTHNCLLSIK